MYELSSSSEDCQKLVAVGILTDGVFRPKPCRNTQLIEFYSNDPILHKAFKNFMKAGFERDKTSYYLKDECRRIIVTGYELSQKNGIVKTLKELSPTYVTKRHSCPQPDIGFLLSEKKRLKQLAVRFAMSCDGCASVAHLKSGEIIPTLKFACAHPTLVMEWKKLFKDIGINTCLDKDRQNWSNIHGIRTTNKESILEFQKIGGFYPTVVKVQGGNFKGLSKNQVLNGICEWLKNKKRDIDSYILK